MNSQKSIDNFLQSVCRFVSTEEKAKDIQDELKDHIYSYIEEYTDDNMSNEDATNLALKQMGDPNVLSKMYKDKIHKYNRLFRLLSKILLLSIFLISDIIYFSISNYEVVQFICFIALTIIVTYQCFNEVRDFVGIYKINNELSKKDALFYIQSYKQSIWEEKAIKYTNLVILCIWSGLFLSILYKVNNLNSLETLSSILLDISLLSVIFLRFMDLSISNPRKKNALVYSEGILMFSAFIPWNNIRGYRWDRENIKGKDCYSLVFSINEPSIFKNSYTVSCKRAPIKVSSSQVNLLNELFKNKNIKPIS